MTLSQATQQNSSTSICAYQYRAFRQEPALHGPETSEGKHSRHGPKSRCIFNGALADLMARRMPKPRGFAI